MQVRGGPEETSLSDCELSVRGEGKKQVYRTVKCQ